MDTLNFLFFLARHCDNSHSMCKDLCLFVCFCLFGFVDFVLFSQWTQTFGFMWCSVSGSFILMKFDGSVHPVYALPGRGISFILSLNNLKCSVGRYFFIHMEYLDFIPNSSYDLVPAVKVSVLPLLIDHSAVIYNLFCLFSCCCPSCRYSSSEEGCGVQHKDIIWCSLVAQGMVQW